MGRVEPNMSDQGIERSKKKADRLHAWMDGATRGVTVSSRHDE